jgi:hypothetical protein
MPTITIYYHEALIAGLFAFILAIAIKTILEFIPL